MPQSFVLCAIFFICFSLPLTVSEEVPRALPPLPPNTSSPDVVGYDIAAIASEIESTLHPENFYPTRIHIPAIRVNSPIEHLGVNAKGEMDVPNGNTNNVGWYKYGTVPGNVGSAVMDAHVYAAFRRLKHAQVGDDVYIENTKGETLHFRIISSKVYRLTKVPMETIFHDSSGAYLNLITCEGTYLARAGTYSHRRVVYAELVQ